MEIFQVIQLIASVLTPFILFIVTTAYSQSRTERAEILKLIRILRSEQDKIKERLYKLELEFNIQDQAPTHMRRPSND